MNFRFGRFELDEEAGELRRDGVGVDVQPKPLALLFLLVRERARVVSSDELFEALWPGVIVTPASLTRAVSMARRAIGDTHRGEVIRSQSRRGYRFTGTVAEVTKEAAARAVEAPATSDAPFVGRDEALASLRDAFGRASRGRGGLVVVSGPAGIGKTRLCDVFTAEVKAAGAEALVGRSHQGEGVPAFWPWAQILRRLATSEDGAEIVHELAGAAAELVALVPGLSGAPAAADPRPDLAPAQTRFLLFDAVTQALARRSARRPTVLVIEDVQWAGFESLRLLEHLTFEVPEHPLLVVATLRDEPREATHPVELVLPRLRQSPACTEIALRELSRGEVATLLERTLGRAAPIDLTSELFARTEGVPLFLREAIRLLSERGDLRNPDGVRRWAITLPPRALDLIRRPLERLSAPTQQLVGVASVIGREFLAELVADVAEVERAAALEALDEAVRAGVVEPTPETPGSFRFTHALFREAAHQGLAPSVRAGCHRRAADALERRHRDDLDRVIAELAHHHHESLVVGDPERAYTSAWRAAERASRLLAHEQAAVHYAQAVQALERGDPPDADRRLEALLALGEAQRLAADREGRRATFARAMEAAQALGRPVDQARAAIGFCDLSEWAANDERGRIALERALRALPDGAEVERVRLETRLAHLSAREDGGRAVPLARQALSLARRLGDPEVLQDAIYGLHFLLAGPDHLDERASLAREAEAAARDAGATDTSLILFLDMACDRLTLGDAEGAHAHRVLAGELAGTQPHPGRAWHLRVFDTGLALLEGRVSDAERCRAEASALGARIAHPYGRGVSRGSRAAIARHRGDDADVLALFEPVLPVRFGPIQWVQTLTARALASAGRTREARAFLEDLAANDFLVIPRNIRWHATILEAAHLVADLGEADRVEDILPLLEPMADHHGVLPLHVGYAGPFRFAIGRLLALAGRLEEAAEALERAEEDADSLGARPARARILLERARLLARRGNAREEARLREASARLAAALGMPGLEAAARNADAR